MSAGNPWNPPSRDAVAWNDKLSSSSAFATNSQKELKPRANTGPPVLLPSATAQSSDSPSSTFVNADGAIGFAFAVPEDAEDQFYFTLRVHRSHAWGAVGLGAEDMPGALYLMVYDNRDQTNTTFSPRLGYGYYEPYHHTDFEYELLEGTGIYDDHMVVMGRCLRNCMTWPAKGTKGGKIDAKSTREKGIYALGPLEGFTSDDKDESLKFHVQYGSFYMDMSRAHGATEPPTLSDRSRSDGAKLDQKYVRKADVMSTMHAVAMILGIVLLMPLGVVMLRLGWWVRWHALNQTIAMVMVLMGFGVGIATSFRYQRVSEPSAGKRSMLTVPVPQLRLVSSDPGLLHRHLHPRSILPWLPSSPPIQTDAASHAVRQDPSLVRAVHYPVRNHERLLVRTTYSRLSVAC